ncbi:amino acid adenylation domain-containing protein [Ruminiclostridium sufflavum DSM 19573]|uniref:Amino acid adenylation domain-containing protein n=1 Tax=Ruminiclostridium sufflavum DSM 19573 TaxID=1121337 RepID=A0A318XRM3_9FIRM|nr:AMP-binding protein [Ruminiclostridium sufflavum]PYG90237.1 amino acid adenylation domain-containing protein [Ruminiclostridium sufflavum DSM 19573]
MRLKRLLDQRIESDSGNMAFISGDTEVSAPEFLKISYGLCKRLCGFGLKKGDRLLILAPKSITSIAYIFSCMLEGYIFTPVDTATPEERLRFIINDCKPGGIVVDTDNINRLGEAFFNDYPEMLIFPVEAAGESLFSLEAFGDSGACQSNKPSGLKDEDKAYIIYTSGSTGTPKGVTVCRSALASFIESSIRKARYTENIRFLNFFPLHFDPVLMEIIMPWVVGGTTVIFNKFLFINDLVKELQKHRITDFSCTPNIISMLVGRISHYHKYEWPSLRSIWFGGESANINDLKRFREITPEVVLFNGYGPTETVIACSLREITEEDLNKDILPIGTPMDEVVFTIVNNGQEVAEDYTAGELYVSGEQLMDGYWGKPAEDEKNNFAYFNGKKHYKTDDNVYRSRGLYYFVGRKSAMIKLRGYRIYPLEIEKALNSLEEIEYSCVVLDEKNSVLVGIVELKDIFKKEAEINEKIVSKLKDKLPAYMIPEKILYEDRLPRMDTGKLDIRKIREMREV